MMGWIRLAGVLTLVLCFVVMMAAVGYYGVARGQDSNGSPHSQIVQRDLNDCCFDVGVLQTAFIDAMNESAAGRCEKARDIGFRALKTTGLECHWTDRKDELLGSPRLVCK